MMGWIYMPFMVNCRTYLLSIWLIPKLSWGYENIDGFWNMICFSSNFLRYYYWKLNFPGSCSLGLYNQCCRKCKILARLTDHLWLMVWWSVSVLSCPINNLLRPGNQSKWTKRGPHFTGAQWTVYISATVELSVHFHSKTFSVKPKESIGSQKDHLW